VYPAARLWQLLVDSGTASLLTWALTTAGIVTHDKFLPSLVNLGPDAVSFMSTTMVNRLAYAKEEVARCWGSYAASLFSPKKNVPMLKECRQVNAQKSNRLISYFACFSRDRYL
jgi:hypothetical protein